MTRHDVYRDGQVHVHAERCKTCIFRPPPRPTTPCVEWTGATSGGYGVRRIAGRNVRVHRLAWEQANGPVPADRIVMHLCDNPPCYRLDHLVLGTHKDNSDDKWAKGRGNAPRGEAAGRARLTEAQVFEVLQRLQQGQSQRSIAKHFGVSAGAIQHIAQGRNWRHLIEPQLGTLMHLEPGRVEGMVAEAVANGSVIPCHDTIYSDDPQPAICRGYWDRHRGDVAALRLAVALGVVVEVEP